MQTAVPPVPGMQKTAAVVSKPERRQLHAVSPKPVEEQQPDPVGNDRVGAGNFDPNSLMAHHKNNNTDIWKKMQNWD